MPGVGDIIHPKDVRNPYVYVGLLGRIVGSSVRSDSHRLLIKGIDSALGKTVLKKIEANSVSNVSKLCGTAKYWHGTGRYQYRDGKIVDVVRSIADSGLLLPNYDAFDITRPMHSVSLARSRVYARAYADMHGRGNQEADRYGRSLFWACAFLGDIAVEAARESSAWKPEGYKVLMEHLLVANALKWFKKMTAMDRPSVLDIYGQGSDIADNYPVLIGIEGSKIETVTTSRAVALHEVRSHQPITIAESVTHVEVPIQKVDEIGKILSPIPAIPIEQGEIYSASFPFSRHMASTLS